MKINLLTQFTLAIIADNPQSPDMALETVGDVPMLKRVIKRSATANLTDKFIVSNTPDKYGHFGLPIVPNLVPEGGIFGSVYSALYHSRTMYTIVIAANMPFVEAGLLDFMKSYCLAHDVVVPTQDDYHYGLHAIYHQNCLEPMRTRLESHQHQIKGFYDTVNVRELPVQGQLRALTTVNTVQELAKARSLAAKND